MSYLLILVLLLGFAPAFIAHSKGRSFFPWWFYGTVLGPVAMLHAMMMRDLKAERPVDRLTRDRPRTSAPWPALVWFGAAIVIAAGVVLAYRTFVPPEFTGFGAPVAVTPKPPAPQTDRRMVRQEPGHPGTTNGAAKTGDPEPPTTRDYRTRMRSTERTAPVPETKSSGRHVSIPLETAKETPPTPVPVAPVAKIEPVEPAKPTAPSAPEPIAPAKPKAVAPPPSVPVAPAPWLQNRDKSKPTDTTATPVVPAAPADPPATAPSEPKKAGPALAKLDPSRKAPPSKTPADKEPQRKPASEAVAVGELVLVVQRGLAERGYDPGNIDGRAHKQTQKAIREFQADRGLKPTGTIDHALLRWLNIVGPKIEAFRTPPSVPPGR
ncbi:MAG: peptidoglycan-binding protein [Alphaproteobacteria bacterium]|nr:peptidoglycan-binding protein [Alphaproteobacteria bacterium]